MRRIVYISELCYKEGKNKNTHYFACIFERMSGRKTKENSKSDHYGREQDERGDLNVSLNIF